MPPTPSPNRDHGRDDRCLQLSLNPGKYIIVEEERSGWYQSEPTSAVVPAADTDYAEKGYAITLTSGQVDDNNYFGNYQKATKAGFKYEDKDLSGDFNTGDAKLSRLDDQGLQRRRLGARPARCHRHPRRHRDHATGAYSSASTPASIIARKTLRLVPVRPRSRRPTHYPRSYAIT